MKRAFFFALLVAFPLFGACNCDQVEGLNRACGADDPCETGAFCCEDESVCSGRTGQCLEDCSEICQNDSECDYPALSAAAMGLPEGSWCVKDTNCGDGMICCLSPDDCAEYDDDGSCECHQPR